MVGEGEVILMKKVKKKTARKVLLDDLSDAFVIPIRAMLASTLAAVSPLQVIGFGKNDIPFLTVVEIFRIQMLCLSENTHCRIAVSLVALVRELSVSITPTLCEC